MSKIHIEKISVTDLALDAIVNAANEGLWEGGGVCGAIFRAAGSKELTKACQAIGHCDTGNAVITPGFRLPAKYVIHAVGPVWRGGNCKEAKLLYQAYRNALRVAKDNNCHSIGFPLISSGIFGYPLEGAWKEAINACKDFIVKNETYDIEITFAVLDDRIMKVGKQMLEYEEKKS
ncbi:MAG: macro domain-containing protein [Eubacteriales bacterium]|nr:macro domain-containing protein [Eubacteriales bacterium]